MAVEFLAQYFELLADRNRSVALAIAARAIPTSANTASQILTTPKVPKSKNIPLTIKAITDKDNLLFFVCWYKWRHL